jgi:hypothetical protein
LKHIQGARHPTEWVTATTMRILLRRSEPTQAMKAL